MEQVAIEQYFRGLRRHSPEEVFLALDDIHRDQETPKRPTISRVATRVAEMHDSAKARKGAAKGHPRDPWEAGRSNGEKAAFSEDDRWWDDRIRAATPQQAKRLVAWRKSLAAGPEVFTASPKPPEEKAIWCV